MNFNEVLNMKASDIERPPLIPQGTYRARVSKIPTMATVGKDDNEWDTLDFPMLLMSPMEDVNTDDLQKAGGLNKSSVRNHRFMFNKRDKVEFDKTLYRLKRFLLDHLQVPGNEETSLKELINNSFNAECAVFIKWTPDKNDKELMYDQIQKTAPLA